MPKGLAYADAVMLLGGSSPAVAAFDKILGGLLTAAVGVPGVLSLFDAKAEAVRVGHLLTTEVRQRVSGAARLDRTRRLQAAHAIVAVTALFDAFDDLDLPFSLRDVELTRSEQARLAGAPSGDGWLPGLLQAAIPAPGPAMPFAAFREELRHWYGQQARRLTDFIGGLAIADRRGFSATALRDGLPEAALRRYEAAYLRLAAEIPEFALWAWRVDADAKDATLAGISAGLHHLEAVLRSIGTGLPPGEQRRALAAAYRADLDQPVAGDEQDTGDCVVPSLAESYLDHRFTARTGGPGDNPADESWWPEDEVRTDLAGFLAGHLTVPEAATAPLIVLGQPGSGKSALTRVLAARLPAEDFLTVRVPLREVPADADLQDQIEHAVRIATGEQVLWPDLARSVASGLRVVLLDGFDELLQATGVSQSDYLMKVAKFQRREAALERPVAFVVTSRIAVANRAPLPEGSTVVRLEPFSEPQIAAWLAGWNGANAVAFQRRGLDRLTAETVARHGELARQPLLLLMLALYDAQDNALQSAATLDRAQLYERLLASFADREIHKAHAGPLAGVHRAEAVERELLQLSVVAFAMGNRDRQWVTAEELDADLTALALGLDPPAPAAGGFAAAQTPGERLVGRFFFIQRAEARQDARRLHTYEFLHATFGEFLVARLTVRLLADLATRPATGLLGLRPPPAHDDLVYALLSFAPLTGQGSTALDFAAQLLARDEPGRAVVHDWLLRAFRHTTSRLDVPIDAYLPALVRAGHRLARYGLNLILLATACDLAVLATDLFPGAADPADQLGRVAHDWQATLSREEWMALTAHLEATRSWAGSVGQVRQVRQVRLSRREVLETVGEPVDVYWAHGFGPDSEVGRFTYRSGFSNYASNAHVERAHQLRADLGEDLFRHALEPLLARIGGTVPSMVVQGPQDAESIAHSLVEAWLEPLLHRPGRSRESSYDRAVTAVVGHGWGPGPHPDAGAAIALVLRMLAHDVQSLPEEKVAAWLLDIADCEQFRGEHVPAVLNCAALAQLSTGLAKFLASLNPLVVPEEWSARDRLLVQVALCELSGDQFQRPPIAPEQLAEVLRGDRALARRYRIVSGEDPAG